MAEYCLEYIAKNGVTVNYVHQTSKYDYDHCLFVFSGFTKGDFRNYRDLSNALTYFPGDIIWIIDYFDESPCYYLCINNDFSIRDAVVEFIHSKLEDFNIGFDKASVTGFSKGGSAAIYYGLLLPFKHIVSTVPQILIGSYVDRLWKGVAIKMMGEGYSEKQIKNLDDIIRNILCITPFNTKRYFYLLTSENDQQYEEHIKPYLDLFNKLGNFFCFKSNSVFCRKHTDITSYHTTFLLSLYYSFANNLSPMYIPPVYMHHTYEYFGREFPIIYKEIDGKPYLKLTYCILKDKKLFVEGIFVLLGYPITSYKDVVYSLVFQSENRNFLFSLGLGSVHNSELTRELSDGIHFINYDKGQFATIKHNGLDLVDIPIDKYKLFINIKLRIGVERTVPLISEKVIRTESGDFICNNVDSDLQLVLTRKC